METSWRFFLLSREAEGMTSAPDAVQVAIHSQPFSATDQLDRWLQRAGSAAAATAVFMGHVRPETMDGAPLEALELSHYPGLCERLLLSFTQQQLSDHGVQSALVLHRVGRLSPGARCDQPEAEQRAAYQNWWNRQPDFACAATAAAAAAMASGSPRNSRERGFRSSSRSY